MVHRFHGDLLIGGMAIRHLDGMLDTGPRESSKEWSGNFKLERAQEDAVEIGRQYLLLLDDGRNAEVMVTEVQGNPDEEDSVICAFEPWARKPK